MDSRFSSDGRWYLDHCNRIVTWGGTTGYAINPARDLGPRLAHAILPIAHKGGSDWGYSWVPVLGPLAGGVVGALIFVTLP
ncbi:hypothetical protein LPIBR_60078 [Lacticaseibacillus paracasei]|nr:hypothetical protein LPIBR_60078 [Lacticaseibacillus paracasei]